MGGITLPFVKFDLRALDQPKRSPDQSSQVPGTAGPNPEASLYTPDVTTSALCSDQRKTILLQMACGVVQNPQKPRNFIELRLLLDSGIPYGLGQEAPQIRTSCGTVNVAVNCHLWI